MLLCRTCTNRSQNSWGNKTLNFWSRRPKVPQVLEKPPQRAYSRAIEIKIIISPINFSQLAPPVWAFKKSWHSLSMRCKKRGQRLMWTVWMQSRWMWHYLCFTWQTTNMWSMYPTTRFQRLSLPSIPRRKKEIEIRRSLIKLNLLLQMQLRFLSSRLISKVK